MIDTASLCVSSLLRSYVCVTVTVVGGDRRPAGSIATAVIVKVALGMRIVGLMLTCQFPDAFAVALTSPYVPLRLNSSRVPR